MEFSYQITEATLLLTPEQGFEIDCVCTIKEPEGLPLKSGKNWADAIHSLKIYPTSTGPYQQPFDDARVGEFSPGLLSRTGHTMYGSWLQLPDVQFNVLYSQLSQGNLKIWVQLCFNEDQNSVTSSGMYEDTHTLVRKVSILTYRVWVTLVSK